MTERPRTLGELRAADYPDRTVKQELRGNLLARLGDGQPLFPGVVGFDDSVLPALERGILAGHDLILLGERGQAKTRLVRAIVNLLDEFVPAIANSATVGNEVHLPPALFQPMASADVAEAVAIAAVNAPVNGITEVGGPQQFRLPDLIRTALVARGDTREVVADPAAGYWGVHIDERDLVPGAGATLFDTRFEDWILEAAAKA